MELPKDISGVVYRYVFDYSYSRLKQQYKDIWLNCPVINDLLVDGSKLDAIYWNDNSSSFETSSRRTANWRTWYDEDEDVYNFYTGNRSCVINAEHY